MESINKIKNKKYFNYFEMSMKIILTFIVCLMATIAGVIVIGTFIKTLDGVLGIEVSQWVSIVGSIIAGLTGVMGGIVSAKHELKVKEEKQVVYIISSIKTILNAEVKQNLEVGVKNYSDKHPLGEDKNFELEQWKRLQYDIIKLEKNTKYICLVTSICHLYWLLEYINKLMYIEPNTVPSSRTNLYIKINNELQVVQEQIGNL